MYLSFQTRQIPLDHLPDAREVDAEIIMDQYISKAGDAAPVDFRIRVLKCLGYMLSDSDKV